MNVTRMLMSAAGGSNGWISIIGGTGNDASSGSVIDSNGDIFVGGTTSSSGAGGTDLLLMKLTADGNLLFAKTFGTSLSDTGRALKIDPNGDLLLGGSVDQGSGFAAALLLKLDPSGNIIWQRTNRPSGRCSFNSLSIDGSGNIAAVGSINAANGPNILVSRLTSAGGTSFTREYGVNNSGETNVNDGGSVNITDASGNFYIAGFTSSASDPIGLDAFLAKWSPSGSILWTRRLFGAFQRPENFGGTVFDANGDILVSGTIFVTNVGNTIALVKYSPNGVLLSRKQIGVSGLNIDGGNINLDADGNIYLAGTIRVGSLRDSILVKCDSSGVPLWARRIRTVTGSTFVGTAGVDSDGMLLMSGRTSGEGAGGDDIFIAKLPPDGTGTGTYGNIVYEEIVVSEFTISLSTSTSGLPSATRSLIAPTVTLTQGTPTFSEEYFPLT